MKPYSATEVFVITTRMTLKTIVELGAPTFRALSVGLGVPRFIVNFSDVAIRAQTFDELYTLNKGRQAILREQSLLRNQGAK